MSNLFFPLSLVLILFCGTLWGQKSIDIPEVPIEMQENANKVLVKEKVIIEVTSINEMNIQRQEIWMVLNEKGDQSLTFSENYDGNTKVKKIQVQYYDSKGKRQERFKKKDFIDVSRTGENLYSDSRKLSAKYLSPVYPHYAVFSSEVETGDTAHLPFWFPVKGYAQSTLYSEYIVKHDADNKLRYKVKNLDDLDIIIEETPSSLTIKG